MSSEKPPKKPRKAPPPPSEAAELRRELARLCPAAFADGRLDAPTLRRALGEDAAADDATGERYRFYWAGRRAAEEEYCHASIFALAPCLAESRNFETTENLYLEGDNLDILRLLRSAYRGRVKMIYIDPPYNTGHDFVYNDKFGETYREYLAGGGALDGNGHDKSAKGNGEKGLNGHRHSRWLSMMYPRLRLARGLLRDDGVIFVSIDDNEVHHLRLLMNLVFGEENFVGCITAVTNAGGRDYGGIARTHEYVMVYAKTKQSGIAKLLDESKKANFAHEDEQGEFEARELRNRNVTFNDKNRPNLFYPFYVNHKAARADGFYDVSLEPKSGWTELYPKESQGVNTVWRWGRKKVEESINVHVVAKKMRDGGFQIVEKYRDQSRMARTVWHDKEVITEKGTQAVKELFGKKIYDFPKPLEMIKRAVLMGSDKDSLILDFFSGSATTGHAVMQLNAEDGGKRRFVLAQLPEPTPEGSEARKAGYKTVADIGKDRLRRAAQAIVDNNGVFAKDLDTGFRVYKLRRSCFSPAAEPTGDLDKDLANAMPQLYADASDEDIVAELMLREGLSLDSEIEIVHAGEVPIRKITDKRSGRLLYVCAERELPSEMHKKLPFDEEDNVLMYCREDALDDNLSLNLGFRCRLMGY